MLQCNIIRCWSFESWYGWQKLGYENFSLLRLFNRVSFLDKIILLHGNCLQFFSACVDAQPILRRVSKCAAELGVSIFWQFFTDCSTSTLFLWFVCSWRRNSAASPEKFNTNCGIYPISCVGPFSVPQNGTTHVVTHPVSQERGFISISIWLWKARKLLNMALPVERYSQIRDYSKIHRDLSTAVSAFYV
jgi:hypothetical protein